jgi:hypothetical protein
MARSTGFACRASIPPSVFAAILDDQKAGRFRIAPSGDQFRRKQFYWPDTAIASRDRG